MCSRPTFPPDKVVRDIVEMCRANGFCAEMASHVAISVVLTIGVNAEEDCEDKAAVAKVKKRVVMALQNATMMMSSDSIDKARLALMAHDPVKAAKNVM